MSDNIEQIEKLEHTIGGLEDKLESIQGEYNKLMQTASKLETERNQAKNELHEQEKLADRYLNIMSSLSDALKSGSYH
jgi:DNA repair exonuclease SbcCD ATPase subunit